MLNFDQVIAIVDRWNATQGWQLTPRVVRAVAEKLRQNMGDLTQRNTPLDLAMEQYREQWVTNCRTVIEALNQGGKFKNGDRQRLEPEDCGGLANLIFPFVVLSGLGDTTTIGTIGVNVDKYFPMLHELRRDTGDGERLWNAWWDEWWLNVLAWGRRRWSLTDSDAQDLAATVIVRFFDSLDGYRFQSSLTTFAFGFFANEVLHYLRTMKRREAHELDRSNEPDDDEVDWLVDSSQSVEGELNKRLFWETLRKCKERLDDKKRRVFELQTQSWKLREIAIDMHTSIGVVSAWSKRARDSVRKCLQAQGIDVSFFG